MLSDRASQRSDEQETLRMAKLYAGWGTYKGNGVLMEMIYIWDSQEYRHAEGAGPTKEYLQARYKWLQRYDHLNAPLVF